MRIATYDGGFGRIEGDRLIRMGDDMATYLRTGAVTDETALALAEIRLRAPMARPGKILSVGPTYAAHAAEAADLVPNPVSTDELVMFGMFGNCVIGPDDVIVIPPVTQQPDYEAELGLVIGRTVRDVEPDEAAAAIWGYTCMNDVSARDIQFRDHMAGLMRGKSADTFLPTGPWIVSADEVGDPGDLRITCTINGEVLQDFSTKEMIFTLGEIVSSISRTITLEPGDMITTGTGVGSGFTRTPPRWLQDGDRVIVEIERVGTLVNTVRRQQ